MIFLLQLAEYAEANCACGYEGENQFEVSIKPLFVVIHISLQVTDRFGHQIFLAEEDSACCFRQCCDSLRGFEMSLSDRQVFLSAEFYRFQLDFYNWAGQTCCCD